MKLLKLLLIFLSLLFSFSCIHSNKQIQPTCNDLNTVLDQRFVQVFSGFNQIERIGSGFLLEADVVVTAFHVIDQTNLMYVYHPGKDVFIEVSYIDFEIEDDLAILYLERVFEFLDLDKPIELLKNFSLNTKGIVRSFIPDQGISDVNVEVSQVFQGQIGDIIELTARLEGGGSGAPILSQNCELLGIIVSHTRRNEPKSYGITTHAIPVMIERGVFHPVRFLPTRFPRNQGTELLPPRLEYYLSLTSQSWLRNSDSTISVNSSAILILQLRNNSNVKVNDLQFSVVLLDTQGNPVDTSEVTISQTLRPSEATLVQVEFTPEVFKLFSQEMLNQFSIIFKSLGYTIVP